MKFQVKLNYCITNSIRFQFHLEFPVTLSFILVIKTFTPSNLCKFLMNSTKKNLFLPYIAKELCLRHMIRSKYIISKENDL